MTSMTGMPPPVPPQFESVRAPDTDQWPGIIGTIAIIFGAAGTLQNGCGVAASLFQKQIYSMVAGAVPAAADSLAALAAQDAASERYLWLNVGLSLLATLVAVMLLVGGIRLLRRRASSVALLRAWAVAKLVLALLLAGYGVVIFASQLEMMQAELQPSGTSANTMRAAAFFGVAFNLIWQWALPIFMLVWFSRAPIRASTARWN